MNAKNMLIWNWKKKKCKYKYYMCNNNTCIYDGWLVKKQKSIKHITILNYNILSTVLFFNIADGRKNDEYAMCVEM